MQRVKASEHREHEAPARCAQDVLKGGRLIHHVVPERALHGFRPPPEYAKKCVRVLVSLTQEV